MSKGTFGTPVAISSPTAGVYLVNRRFYFPDNPVIQAYTAVEEGSFAPVRMQPNSVITLPNGAIYDVNQTYDAPFVMQPIEFSFKIYSEEIISDLYMQNGTGQVHLLQEATGERATLFVATVPDSSTMHKILTRLDAVEASFAKGFGFQLITVNIRMIPIETDFTSTSSFT